MSQRQAFSFLLALPALLLLTGLVVEPLADSLPGVLRIITARSLLLSDYLAIGGIGATLMNAGVCGLVAVALVAVCKIQVNGPFIAAVYTVIGFAFFGKNVYNIWPIFAGALLYTRAQRVPFRNSLLIALFGTTLAPLVSFFSFAAGLTPPVGIVLGVVFGTAVGFVLPPLASHMLRFHDGYNIYNVGFTGGVVGSFFVAVFRSFRFEISAEVVLIDHPDRFFEVYFAVIFVALITLGVYLGRTDYAKLGESIRRVLSSTGRLVSDFVQIGDYGSTLINMGVMGLISAAFVLLLGGRFNGPVIGGVLTVVGFAAFGKHPLNCVPVLAGVVLASFLKVWETSTTVVIIAGLFGTTLAPISGQFGPLAGVAAGFFHLSIVMNVGILHGGVNLYNNGFAGGFVAAFLTPVLDAFRRDTEEP
jgi:hypothetical protein